MKDFFIFSALWMVFLLLVSGCSGEEPTSAPTGNPKVVKAIVKPEQKTKAEIGPSQEVGQQDPANPGEEAPVPALPEKEVQRPAAAGNTKEGQEIEGDRGHYVVRQGDSLSAIAGRDEVYGDPLKWPILCRHNMGKLDALDMWADFPDKGLPMEMRLRIIDAKEMRKNLKERDGRIWVVNAFSSMKNEEIVPIAIRLLKKGYPVYITRVKVKEKDWLRIRVGFYGTKTEAEEEGKKVKAVLHSDDLWVTKIGKSEFEEFAGF